jgi:hypothetical protein
VGGAAAPRGDRPCWSAGVRARDLRAWDRRATVESAERPSDLQFQGERTQINQLDADIPHPSRRDQSPEVVFQ